MYHAQLGSVVDGFIIITFDVTDFPISFSFSSIALIAWQTGIKFRQRRHLFIYLHFSTAMDITKVCPMRPDPA